MTTTVQPRYDDVATAPLDLYWHHYSGQYRHQTVVLSLDLHDGELLVEYDGTVGNSTPADVWEGRVLWFALPYIPTPAAANALLDRVAPIAQAILDAAADDSDARRATLQLYLDSGADFDDSGIVAVWELDDIGQGWLDDVTAEMTDEQIDAYSDEILSDLALNCGHGAAVCHGLTDWLRSHRDDLRAAVTA